MTTGCGTPVVERLRGGSCSRPIARSSSTGLRADPRLQFVYVPGAFTWAEFDFETMNAAQRAGDLDYASHRRWHPARLAGSGRDLRSVCRQARLRARTDPFSDFADPGRHLVRPGCRRGRDGDPATHTGEFNFHLSQAPAHGTAPTGALVVDETLPVHNGRYVVGMENRYFTDCGFHTGDVPYAVVQTNLFLRLRANWPKSSPPSRTSPLWQGTGTGSGSRWATPPPTPRTPGPTCGMPPTSTGATTTRPFTHACVGWPNRGCATEAMAGPARRPRGFAQSDRSTSVAGSSPERMAPRTKGSRHRSRPATPRCTSTSMTGSPRRPEAMSSSRSPSGTPQGRSGSGTGAGGSGGEPRWQQGLADGVGAGAGGGARGWSAERTGPLRVVATSPCRQWPCALSGWSGSGARGCRLGTGRSRQSPATVAATASRAAARPESRSLTTPRRGGEVVRTASG